MSLVLNIFTDYIGGNFVANTADKVTIIPQLSSPKLFSQLRKFLKHFHGPRYFSLPVPLVPESI